MRFGKSGYPRLQLNAAEIRMSDPQYDLIVTKWTTSGLTCCMATTNFELRHYPSFRFGRALEGKCVHANMGFSFTVDRKPRTAALGDRPSSCSNWRGRLSPLFLTWQSQSMPSSVTSICSGGESGETEVDQYPDESTYSETQKNYYVTRLLNRVDGRT